MRPGDILSRIFDVPLAIMSTSSYRGDQHQSKGIWTLPTYPGQIAGRVLLVDDLADSGKTLHAVMDMLRAKYPAISDIRSAVLWTKGVSTFAPDYSVQNLPTSPWIHQPL